MTVILVDTARQIVSLEDVGHRLELERIYELLDCGCFEAHSLPGYRDHAFYCDEEGRLKDPSPPAFILEGFPYLMFGNILIFRRNGDEEASPTVSVEEIAEHVVFTR